MFRGAQSCSSILSAGCSVNVFSKYSSRLSIRRSLLPRPVQSTRKEFLSSAARSNAEVGNANVDKSEGDVNLSSLRGDWQASHISSETRAILDEDSKYFLHQTLSTPCLNALQKVDGIWLEDTQGRRYMDFHGNSVHQVGFSNKYVLDAIKQQLDSLSFCTRRYTNQTSIDLARRLVEEARAATNHMMPTDARPDSPLSRVLFTPGGTAAVGIALKLARLATGRFKTISMWDSFHGASLDSISVGGEAAFRRGIGPLLPGTEHVPPPDEYRCLFGCQSTGCSMKCADFIEYVLEKEGDVAAVIAEPIRWLPYIPPKEYWQRVRKACNKHGALLIFDEIPNSLGRTGVGLFSFQMFDVVPDIVVVGKGLGGGVLPIAAVLAREHLNEYSKLAALGHYTHEKNPVLCASGLATLNYIRDHNLIENARVLGLHGLKRMKALQQKYELVGDVRGQGLLMGIELVTNRVTKERAAKEAETILYECLSRGLSFKLTMQSIITLCPPLTITQEELDKAFDIVDECIGLVSKK